MDENIYAVKRPPRSKFIRLRDNDYHLNVWGPSSSRTLYMLHGWGDCGGSFQFLVDALADDWRVIAPDWRGFGQTECKSDTYYFPDYLADLDSLLLALSPDQPVTLVGHSMGGNIASLYSGIFPERVAALINIEGFGLRETKPGSAPARYRQWLDELRSPPRYRDYRQIQDLADRIRERSPGLSPERAGFVAGLWSRTLDGVVSMKASPAHKITNPVLYRREEARACWRRIIAPTLLVVGGDTNESYGDALRDMAAAELAAPVRIATIPECGHMIHFEQPDRLAREIENFISSLDT